MDIPFISDILDWMQSLWDWVYVGVYDFVKSAFVLATKMAVYSYLQMVLFAADIGYTVFKEIMDGIGVSNVIRNAYSALDPQLRMMLAYFKIPEALNMIFSALGTRFVMQFIPFVGR